MTFQTSGRLSPAAIAQFAEEVRYYALPSSNTQAIPVLIVGSYLDCTRVAQAAVGSAGSYELPSLGGSTAALRNVATNISPDTWLMLTDIDRWLNKDRQLAGDNLIALLSIQERRGFPMIASAEALTDTLKMFPAFVVLLLDTALAPSAPRRFSHRDAWQDDDSFDGVRGGLMDMPSFRRKR